MIRPRLPIVTEMEWVITLIGHQMMQQRQPIRMAMVLVTMLMLSLRMLLKLLIPTVMVLVIMLSLIHI